MDRKVPLRLVLVLVLLGALFTMLFGWAVRSTVSGHDVSGRLGRLAVEIASFPTRSGQVLAEVGSYAFGDYRDEALRVLREQADLSGFAPVPAAPGLALDGLLMRADPAAVEPGWRLLVAAVSLDGAVRNAALLLSPDLGVATVWPLGEDGIDGLTPQAEYRKFAHGVAVLPDASIVLAFDGGVSLQRIDRCGRRLWARSGRYHHAVTASEDGASVWTLRDDNRLIQVAAADGTVLRELSMQEIIDHNPMIDILELRKLHEVILDRNSRDTPGTWLADRFHLNDVDPLPAALADRFPGLEAGDLLVSARSLNLVFVVDPDSARVKWWRIGAVQRQHDPDWQPDGTISIYNNRLSRDFSEIVALDPATFARATLLDGRDHDFYSRIRGKHQITPGGHILVASAQQGRAFEVDRHGRRVLEIVNTKPGSVDTNYVVSDLMWLPPDAIPFDPNAWEETACGPQA